MSIRNTRINPVDRETSDTIISCSQMAPQPVIFSLHHHRSAGRKGQKNRVGVAGGTELGQRGALVQAFLRGSQQREKII
jgi:hypothetical protein